jgi:pimeloyl-ACP methyl ester carboxylesterase
MPQLTQTPFVLTPPHGRAFSADATYQENGQPKPVVIFVHGFKGFKDWGTWNLLARFFAEQGFAFIKLNLSHNGTVPGNDGDLHDMEAFGHNNFSIELADLDTLLDHIFSEACPFKAELNLEKIAIIGHSRGGGLVLLKAAEDTRLNAVITWAAVSNLNPGYGDDVISKWKTDGVIYNLNTRTNQQMPLYYQLYEDFAANPERFDVQKAAAGLTQPLLIVHGDQDPVVPVSRAQELKTAQPAASLEILPGADHSFGGKHPYAESNLPEKLREAAEKTVSFLTKNLHLG